MSAVAWSASERAELLARELEEALGYHHELEMSADEYRVLDAFGPERGLPDARMGDSIAVVLYPVR